MLIKVDWISFSVLVAPQPDAYDYDMAPFVLDALLELHPEFGDWLEIDGKYTYETGRRPYSICFRHPNNGVSIYAHNRLSHASIEITGRGCDMLIEKNLILPVLYATKTRLTRLDLACDMLTDTVPLDFVTQRKEGRFKSHAEQVSGDGSTCYVGAKTSDRFAKVYRYNPPHERAHLLRCEYTVRAENAKLLAEQILQTGQNSCAKALGVIFGWQHKDWHVEDATDVELKAYRPDRKQGKTLFWLADTIAPLMVRLHKEGVIDAEQWFAENVMSGILSGNDQ